jgi:hypothetical protein
LSYPTAKLIEDAAARRLAFDAAAAKATESKLQADYHAALGAAVDCVRASDAAVAQVMRDKEGRPALTVINGGAA